MNRVPTVSDVNDACCVIGRVCLGIAPVNFAEAMACHNVLAAYEQGRPVEPRPIDIVHEAKGRGLCNPCS